MFASPWTDFDVIELPPLGVVEPRELAPPFGAIPPAELPALVERVVGSVEPPLPPIADGIAGVIVECSEFDGLFARPPATILIELGPTPPAFLFSSVAEPPRCIGRDDDAPAPAPPLTDKAETELPPEPKLGDSSDNASFDGLLPEHASVNASNADIEIDEEGSRMNGHMIVRAIALGVYDDARSATSASGMIS